MEKFVIGIHVLCSVHESYGIQITVSLIMCCTVVHTVQHSCTVVIALPYLIDLDAITPLKQCSTT